MKYGLVVLGGPYQSQASDSALHFARALIAEQHTLTRVFFYNDGVNNATRLATPPQDDRNLAKAWSELGESHGVDLVACVAAAQRRGLVDATERDRQGKDVDNIAPNFRISGLGQLMDMALEVDRVVTFGG